MKQRTYLALGTILIALLVFFPSRKDDDGSERDRELVKSSRVRRGGMSNKASESSKTFTLRGPLKKEEKKTHEFSDLIEFYHPRMKLENVTLSEGMRRLMEEYEKICEETGETVLPLRWQIDGASRVIPEINLEGHFFNSCRKLALHARMRCEIEEGTVVFTELESGLESSPQKKRTWKVVPTFSHHLEKLTGRSVSDDAQRDEVPFEGPYLDDLPIGPNSTIVIRKAGGADLSEQLRELGILEAGEQVRLFQGPSQLNATAGSGSLEWLGILVEMSAAEMPRQIRYELQHRVGGELAALPTIVTLSGQPATLEMGQEYVELRGDEVVKTMVGTTVDIQGELYGFGERSVVNYTHIDPPSAADLARYQQTGRLADLNLEPSEIDSQFLKRADERSGQGHRGAVFSPEGELDFILTSQRIDATGRVVPGPMAE